MVVKDIIAFFTENLQKSGRDSYLTFPNNVYETCFRILGHEYITLGNNAPEKFLNILIVYQKDNETNQVFKVDQKMLLSDEEWYDTIKTGTISNKPARK